MKMKKIIFLIMILSAAASLSFAQWDGTGISVSGQDNDIVLLKDSEGHSFELVSKGTVSNEAAGKIKKMKNIFYQFEKISFSSLRFMVRDDGVVEAYLILSKLTADNTDIHSFVPSGMVFYFNSSLSYDFRMVKNNVFFKIKGQFIGEKELLKKILNALENPVAYLEQNSLESLKAKIELQQMEFEKMKQEFIFLRNSVLMLHNTGFLSGPKQIQTKKIERAIELKKQNPGWKKEDIAKKMDSEKIDVSEDEIGLILAIFFNEFE